MLIAALQTTTPVAHYAVYEKRWLDWLTGLDIQFVCTRKLSFQSNPDLVSGTLRAVAGAFGYSLNEKRRALDHVLATEYIYNVIEQSVCMKKLSREEWLALPKTCGVYRFFGLDGKLLYIGKAKNLCNRVNSHFTCRQKGRHAELISCTLTVNYIETSSALEAAILESLEILKYLPQYNVAGKFTDNSLWYINFNLTKLLNSPEERGCFGPFSTDLFLIEFLRLMQSVKIGTFDEKIVENFLKSIEETFFKEGFYLLLKNVQNNSLLQYSKVLYSSKDKKKRTFCGNR